eukprot:TRINITY_DN1716_c0_g2_i2.p1 TRINITY_DN1716_c0_g2~~TRINITY_DN1716_c0_g2_i2.p1  ORF type:complete len:181 (-),score=51.05 TRINITY_DN1716_c0_g2_i2:61-540(-)
MARSRAGTRFLSAAVLACIAALFASHSRSQERASEAPAFAPLRAAALAGLMAAGMPGDAALAENAAQVYSMDSSNIILADRPVNIGGKAGGGLDGTYTMKEGAKRADFNDDAQAIKREEKFEQKFDEYIGVFGILFVGAFIAPMVTYFWYVRDTDPFEN